MNKKVIIDNVTSDLQIKLNCNGVELLAILNKLFNDMCIAQGSNKASKIWIGALCGSIDNGHIELAKDILDMLKDYNFVIDTIQEQTS